MTGSFCIACGKRAYGGSGMKRLLGIMSVWGTRDGWRLWRIDRKWRRHTGRSIFAKPCKDEAEVRCPPCFHEHDLEEGPRTNQEVED